MVVGVTGAVRMGRASGRTTALLSFLDLSAAFDIVDHDTLLQRLQTSYGLGGNDIAWFASYVTGRTQYARNCSVPVGIVGNVAGVPQGSAGFCPKTHLLPPLRC